MNGVICELSNAHNGDRDRAHRIIEACADAGAAWMKFQCYLPEELAELRGVPLDEMCTVEPWTDKTMGELYGQAQTPHSWFPSLIRKCNEVGIPWFSSVFGLDSLDLLEKLGCPTYKLASLDLGQDGFRHEVRQTGKPCVVSMPEDTAIKGVQKLFCPPGYPQPKNLKAMKRALTWADGLSYHGTDWTVPAKAFEYGAKLVEVHVQLDDEPSDLEANVSLNISDVKKLVESTRREVDLGTVVGRRPKGKTTVTAKMEVLK